MIRNLFIAMLLLAGIISPASAQNGRPVTILISLDGFRWDYLDRNITPKLSALAAAGVRGRMQASFPTKTFPNHYSIVTGLTPDHHAIVGNSMIDPMRPAERFSLGDPKQSLDPFWWNEAEPIWVTAQKQGVRTATMFWPGSEVFIKEQRPADWQRFDQNISADQRVRTVIDWMRRPADIRPQLVTLYFDAVDTAGHRFGPDSAEVNAAIAALDGQIGTLTSGLEALGIAANIVITADHGMTATSDARIIQLDDILPRNSYIAVETGPYAAIEPAAGTDNRVAEALLKPHDHMTCYAKEKLPKRLRYGTNPRVAAIICLAEGGWTILSGLPQYPVNGGAHGYDNEMPDMDAVFIALGPAIKQVQIARFSNLDVYTLIARLIGVTPLANDGSPKLAQQIVK